MINNHSKVEEVYKKSKKYLKIHSNLEDEIAIHLLAYYNAIDLIPQTIEHLGSGHFFPFVEAYYELESSLELCMHGFYRHSFFSLRCVLEFSVIGLYFDKDDRAHIDIQKWLHSQDYTPYFRASLKRLFKLKNFHHFNEVFFLQKKIEDLYSLLSDYVHVRGYQYSSIGQSQSNFNRFNESVFCQYVELMKEVVKSAVTMILLKYPLGIQNLPLRDKFGLNLPVGGFLDKTSQQAVLAVLDGDTIRVLQNISNNDPTVKRIISYILAMPDLTEEQLKKQIVKWDEIMKKQDIRKQKDNRDSN